MVKEQCRRGKYVLNENNNLVYRSWITQKEQKNDKWVNVGKRTEDIPVSELGYTKKIEDNIILKKTVPSRETFEGFDVLLFLKKIVYEVRKDKPYVYLIKTENKQSRKVCIKDFDSGVTGFVPTKSNEFVTVEESKAKLVSEEKVKEMYNQGLISDVFESEQNVNNEKIYKKRVFA